jgi:uncharacterized RDD family membrane protein YckC
VVLATKLVTPEAVVLDLPTAGVGSRMLCRMLDLLVTWAGFMAITLVVDLVAGGSDVATIILLIEVAAALLLYPALMETFWHGRTVGKVVLGLRVVRVDGGPIGFRHAAIRAALGLIDLWGTLGGAGTLAIFLSRHDQRLGDMAAGTLVLRERRGGQLQPVRFSVPPGCEPIVKAMDVGAMTVGDYELVRSFLVRWRDFGDLQRPAVAARLAGPLWQRFRHPIPAWLGPDYYLACLGAAYQFRHPLGGPATGPATAPAYSGDRSAWATAHGWAAADYGGESPQWGSLAPMSPPRQSGQSGQWGPPQRSGPPQQRDGPQPVDAPPPTGADERAAGSPWGWHIEPPTLRNDECGRPGESVPPGAGGWAPPA